MSNKNLNAGTAADSSTSDEVTTSSQPIANAVLSASAVRNPCHICIYWTPLNGCKHYMPDSETVLKNAGYRIYKPGIDTRQKKFIVCKDNEQHKFESLAKAAAVLIHGQ